MASVPGAGGAKKKKLTLQIKKRYQIGSPTREQHLNNSGKSGLFTKCGNSSRKQLLSLCIPKSSLVQPLPATTLQLVSDGKAEATLSSSLPAPNFELLTSRMPTPLDLKRCQSHSVIALDQQKPEMSNVVTTANQIVFPIGLHNVGGAAPHDIHKSIPNALNKLYTSSNYSAVQKRKSVATAVSSSHVTQAPRKVKVDNSATTSNHHMTTSSAKQDTSNSHTTTFTSGSLSMSGVGETYRVPLDGSDRGENLRKRTWSEDASDDEFDTLCNMVDLSFDTDVVTSDQVTEATTPDIDKWSDGQNVCHPASTTVGSTGQSWTCPMCNEQFEGRSADAYECEQHLVECLAMDQMDVM